MNDVGWVRVAHEFSLPDIAGIAVRVVNNHRLVAMALDLGLELVQQRTGLGARSPPHVDMHDKRGVRVAQKLQTVYFTGV